MEYVVSFKNALVYYHSEFDALFLEYTNKVTSHDQFVLINSAALYAFTELSTTKFVTDVRKMGVIGSESQLWLIDHLLPCMQEHLNEKQLVHIQLLNQFEIFSWDAGKQIKDKSFDDNGIRIFPFTDEIEMKEYLYSSIYN